MVSILLYFTLRWCIVGVYIIVFYSKVVYCNNTIVGVYSRRLNVSRQLMAPKVQIVTGTCWEVLPNHHHQLPNHHHVLPNHHHEQGLLVVDANPRAKLKVQMLFKMPCGSLAGFSSWPGRRQTSKCNEMQTDCKARWTKCNVTQSAVEWRM